MKAIMISIKPQWCAKIMNGDKTIEVRKNKALANAIQKLIDENGYADIYVYCSKDSKNILHKNCADIYWVEDKDFRNKNKQLGLQTQPILNGKVLFKFRCYKVEEWHNYSWQEITKNACLTDNELRDYSKGVASLYLIHISNLKIFDKPKELSEFNQKFLFTNCNKCQFRISDYLCESYSNCTGMVKLTKAPQNFCYLEINE